MERYKVGEKVIYKGRECIVCGYCNGKYDLRCKSFKKAKIKYLHTVHNVFECELQKPLSRSKRIILTREDLKEGYRDLSIKEMMKDYDMLFLTEHNLQEVDIVLFIDAGYIIPIKCRGGELMSGKQYLLSSYGVDNE